MFFCLYLTSLKQAYRFYFFVHISQAHGSNVIHFNKECKRKRKKKLIYFTFKIWGVNLNSVKTSEKLAFLCHFHCYCLLWFTVYTKAWCHFVHVLWFLHINYKTGHKLWKFNSFSLLILMITFFSLKIEPI